jgi:hypothetical protein
MKGLKVTSANWPARRPDGQTAETQSDPAPTVKGSSIRPGTEKLTVRVPTQKARKFKLMCKIYGLEQQEEIERLLDYWLESLGRPDGQTARRPDGQVFNKTLGENSGTETAFDLLIDDLRDDDEEKTSISSSSSLLDPAGQTARRPEDRAAALTKQVLAYYSFLTGNLVKQNDRDVLAKLIHLPAYTLQAGIALSFARAKTPIMSFAYCRGGILEVAEQKLENATLEVFLSSIERALRRDGKLKPLEAPTQAARQPTLPGAGADLVDLRGPKTEDPK